MTAPMPDEMKVRLVDRVIVTHPDDRRPVVVGPDDDVPGWARDQITNPAAWGITQPDTSRPVTNSRHDGRRDDLGRPNVIEVWCDGRRTVTRGGEPFHRPRRLARFETTLLVDHLAGDPDDDADGWAAREVWEWWWTTEQEHDPRTSRGDHGRPSGLPTDADGHVPADVAADLGEAAVVDYNPAGERRVHLRCDVCAQRSGGRRRPDVVIRWPRWEAILNDHRRACQDRVDLADLDR